MRPSVTLLLPASTVGRMFREQDLARLRAEADVVGPCDVLTSLEMARALGAATVALTGWGTPAIPDEVFDQAPSLKLVAHSAGTVKYLIPDGFFGRGLRITTAASANAVPVAHFTVAMMVSLLKQTPWIAAAYAAGDAQEVERRRGVLQEMQDISVGILGASRVGREVIRLLKCYPGVTVKVYDPYLSPAGAAALGVELVDLDTACRCPVVSVHAPNTPETRHMLSVRTLALLPDHAVLINTARGALLDEAALLAEMRRRPLYAALDVTDPEPPAADSPLRREKNIILTPHIAGAMNQACREMGAIAIGEIIRFLHGQPLQHEVTETMFATQA